MKGGGDVAALVDYAVENSCCTSSEKLSAWFAVPRTADDLLNAAVWPVKYNDGTLKDESPKFTFKTEGRTL